MSRAFADIAFTLSVKRAQLLYGSREHNRVFEQEDDPRSELTEEEIYFIQARDSFYQATVGENGWPYVQHRGGPSGFLKVIDPKTIGYADYRGNRQYISVGNINSASRVSLILMDYANRRRLKIWGCAYIIHEPDDPALFNRLEDVNYRARVERGVIIKIEALEWNCPQHITPRFTNNELSLFASRSNYDTYAPQQKQPGITDHPSTALGNGQLSLVVSGMRQLTPRIRAYELRSTTDRDLPAFSAGSHIKIPVILPNGEPAIRYYSICSSPAELGFYEIAVLRENETRGGSEFIHKNFTLGFLIRSEAPANHFPLSYKSKHAVLIAAGIGITPIRSMIYELRFSELSFEIHYAGRHRSDMAYISELEREFGSRLCTYISGSGERINFSRIIVEAPSNSDFYICGPKSFIDDFLVKAHDVSINAKHIHVEAFARTSTDQEKPIQLYLHRSNISVHVQKNETILDALIDAGIEISHQCKSGVCGSCKVKVITGIADHRDFVLDSSQREAGLLCTCVSRAHSEHMEIDL